MEPGGDGQAASGSLAWSEWVLLQEEGRREASGGAAGLGHRAHICPQPPHTTAITPTLMDKGWDIGTGVPHLPPPPA